ncbi:hypothetical protein [Azomonas agilis]|uniref:hypothetical protein n=1 Tax=Azomonas agilis TaxID=116849 RepID=UPI0011A94A85|nr:hypothetical protein [Azomonas agilis]
MKEALLADPKVQTHLTAERLDALLNPAAYTGLAGFFVDRVTGKHPAKAHA